MIREGEITKCFSDGWFAVTFPRLMKRITFSLFSVLLLIGAGCERHPASELEGEEPQNAESAKLAESPAPAAEAAPSTKPDEAGQPGAPKFFPDSAK